MSVVLALMAKNEAKGIAATLESVKPLIDAWSVVDTGSTDGTPGIVRDVLKGIPGKLHKLPWKDFGSTRTQTLRLAAEQGTDWILWCDVDDRAEGTFVPPDPDIDVCWLDYHYDSLLYRRPMLIRVGKPWVFRGVVHEYLDCEEPTRNVQLKSPVFRREGSAGTKERFKRDKAALLAEHLADPAESRTVFYLAQTCRDLGDIPEAIRWFSLRAMMRGGFEEEGFYAQYQAGVLTSGFDWRQGLAMLLQAWDMRPIRAEPLWSAVQLCRHHGLNWLAETFEAQRKQLPLPANEVHFIIPHAYDGEHNVQKDELQAIPEGMRQA